MQNSIYLITIIIFIVFIAIMFYISTDENIRENDIELVIIIFITVSAVLFLGYHVLKSHASISQNELTNILTEEQRYYLQKIQKPTEPIYKRALTNHPSIFKKPNKNRYSYFKDINKQNKIEFEKTLTLQEKKKKKKKEYENLIEYFSSLNINK